MRIVALGLDEFADLQQVVGKILRDLSTMPADVKTPQIVFGWPQGRLGVGVNSGDQTNVKKVYYANTPVGLSVNRWATTILREIENHLLSGSRFSIQEVTGGRLEDPYFKLPLERV